MSVLEKLSAYERREPYFEVALRVKGTDAFDRWIFRNPASRVDLDGVMARGREWATEVIDGRAGPAFVPFLSLGVEGLCRVAVAFGLFAKVEFSDDTEVDQISQLEWCQIADKNWQLFGAISDGIDKQISETGVVLRRKALDEAKKNSASTADTTTSSEQPQSTESTQPNSPIPSES